MSGIKLVAIDIDGTLLDPYGEITPRTKAAMEAVANLDIQIRFYILYPLLSS